MDNKAASRALYKPFATILLVSLLLSGLNASGASSAVAQEPTPVAPPPAAAPTAAPPMPEWDADSHPQDDGGEIYPLPATYTLQIEIINIAYGFVESWVGGVQIGQCPSDNGCSATFDEGTVVDLVAHPRTSHRFVTWSGECDGGAGCTVTMSGDRSVTATFGRAATSGLGVFKVGSGSGTVTSSPAGIDCGPTCAYGYHAFWDYTEVTLTATAEIGSTFAGWTGGVCSGTGTCVISAHAPGSAEIGAIFDGGPTGWAPIAPSGTSHVFLAAATAYGKVYAVGGNDTSVVEAYDPGSNTWTARASKPTLVGQIAAAVIDNKIYVPGGVLEATGADIVEVYDPITDTWSTSVPMPVGLHGHAVAAIGQKLYVLGGSTSAQDPLKTCYVFDAGTGFWSTCGTMHFARLFSGAGVVNGKLYVVGGLDNGAQELTSVEEFTPPSTWTIRAPMLVARMAPGVVGYGNKLYTCGGGYYTALFSCEQYSPTANTWSPFDSMHRRRLGSAMTALSGKLYALGGSEASPYPTGNEDIALTPTCYSLMASVAVSGGGSMDVAPAPNCNDGSQYAPGTPVQLTASADPDFVFSSWTGDAAGNADPLDISMNSDMTIVAHFQSTLVAPTIIRFYPLHNGTTCQTPQVGVKLGLSNMVRDGNGSFDPSTVTLKLDNIDRTSAAKITQSLTYPVNEATIMYTPPSNLSVGMHSATFTYPSPGGPITEYWGFTLSSITCPTSAQLQAPLLQGSTSGSTNNSSAEAGAGQGASAPLAPTPTAAVIFNTAQRLPHPGLFGMLIGKAH